jgi:hypothetical protein
MMQMSSYEAQLMVRMFVEERHREADIQRLLRQVQSRRPRWLLLQALRLLHWLGCMLIVVGQCLQQSASVSAGALGSEKGARP